VHVMETHLEAQKYVVAPKSFGVTAQKWGTKYHASIAFPDGRHALGPCVRLRKFWRAAGSDTWRSTINFRHETISFGLQITHSWTPLLHQPELSERAWQPCNMADALKAEGNKAFAAKNFEEAMYVQAATGQKLY
jgi:hypothetical protein